MTVFEVYGVGMPFFRFFHSSFHIDPNNRDNRTVYLMGADEKCQAPPGPIFEYRIPIAIVFLDPTNRKNDVAWRWRSLAEIHDRSCNISLAFLEETDHWLMEGFLRCALVNRT